MTPPSQPDPHPLRQHAAAAWGGSSEDGRAAGRDGDGGARACWPGEGSGPERARMPEFDDESGGSDSDAGSARPGPVHLPQRGGRAVEVALPALWAAPGPKKLGAGRAAEVALPRRGRG